MRLGEFIRIKRKKLGFSVWKLAELCDASGSYISLIETGKISTNPSEELIKKVANELRLDQKDKNTLYELYAEHVIPKIVKESRKKELKTKKNLEIFALKLLAEGIDIDTFNEKQLKRLVSQAKLIYTED